MLSRFTLPLTHRVRAARRPAVVVGNLWSTKTISTSSPAMIRIRKPSESIPETPEKPASEEKAEKPIGEEKAEKPIGEEKAEKPTSEETTESQESGKVAPEKDSGVDGFRTDSAAGSEKPSNASPFGFSSAGSGMAGGILGAEPGAEDGGNGAQNARSGQSAAEARRARRQRADLPPLEDEPKVKAAKYIGSGLLFGLLIGGIGYYGRPFTAKESDKGMKDDPELNALQQLWRRAAKRTAVSFSFLSEPATEKLLPDANEYTMPYTLVLNLDDMLIHMDWSKEHGWRIAKRPGLDHFLAYMASMFEVVIFSTQPSHSGMLVLERLDPLEYAPYRLYKDHMRNIDGKNYKDLSTINRDMSRVIMIDTDPEAFKMQPDNGLLARPFRGEPGDNWIEQMTEFLEYVHMMEPKDVRAWIKTYQGRDAAYEFTKWENSIRSKLIEEWEEKRKLAGSWKAWVFGGAPADLENPPKPEFDQMRKMMRDNFEVQHKEVLAIIEKERVQNEEEMKRQMKDMTVWKMLQKTVKGPPVNPPVSTDSASDKQA